MKEDGSEWGHRSTCAPHPRANPQPRPCLATPTGRPELPSVSQWLAAWRPRATEAQRSAQRGSKAGGAGHFQCQPFRPIGRTGLVLWGDGLGWACPCPHQEGLGAQPGRDESSLGPSAGAARDPEPDPGEGCGGRRTGAAGLWPGGWGWEAGGCVDEQGRVGSREGKRGRVWGQAPTSWSPRQAPSLSWGGQEQGLEGR